MKQEVKTPVLIAIVAVLAVIIVGLGIKFLGHSGDLDQGQVKYTPGVPPWKEKGASGKYQPVPSSPSASGPPQSAPGTPPAGVVGPAGAPSGGSADGAGHAPPGMGPPARG